MAAAGTPRGILILQLHMWVVMHLLCMCVHSCKLPSVLKTRCENIRISRGWEIGKSAAHPQLCIQDCTPGRAVAVCSGHLSICQRMDELDPWVLDLVHSEKEQHIPHWINTTPFSLTKLSIPWTLREGPPLRYSFILIRVTWRTVCCCWDIPLNECQ